MQQKLNGRVHNIVKMSPSWCFCLPRTSDQPKEPQVEVEAKSSGTIQRNVHFNGSEAPGITHYRFQDSDFDDFQSLPDPSHAPINQNGLPEITLCPQQLDVVTRQPSSSLGSSYLNEEVPVKRKNTASCSYGNEDGKVIRQTGNDRSNVVTFGNQDDNAKRNVAATNNRDRSWFISKQMESECQEKNGEIECLKNIVHKLSAELSRFQLPSGKEEGVIPVDGPPPPWLHDVKYFVPLQVAFEEEIREKEAIIADYEKELMSLKSRANNVVKENEELVLKLDKLANLTSVDPDQHLLLTESSQVLTNENELLREKITNCRRQRLYVEDTLNSRIKDMSNRIKHFEQENAEITLNLKTLEKENKTLNHENNKLSAKLQESMPSAEHERSVAALQVRKGRLPIENMIVVEKCQMNDFHLVSFLGWNQGVKRHKRKRVRRSKEVDSNLKHRE